tara:strand:+ start:230 stop:385 length:156 start_codon:yes stop_codon:yes gene_type:complete
MVELVVQEAAQVLQIVPRIMVEQELQVKVLQVVVLLLLILILQVAEAELVL